MIYVRAWNDWNAAWSFPLGKAMHIRSSVCYLLGPRLDFGIGALPLRILCSKQGTSNGFPPKGHTLALEA